MSSKFNFLKQDLTAMTQDKDFFCYRKQFKDKFHKKHATNYPDHQNMAVNRQNLAVNLIKDIHSYI